jgi:hypothetical protein
MTKTGNAQRASEICGELLEAVYRWDAEVDAFMQTGDDDADVVVTHDGRGRMIELSIRPGLQEELTTEELEDAINDEIARNAQRGHEGLNAIAHKFLARFANIPGEVTRHPVAAQFASALRDAE